ncbi:hypothetical protein HAX54_043912 [Datura stramonium]|uniref:Uncharacterized protein n=1 Tax=Datura stramonium TaxID=4076 RepID=A0ABS8W4B5_DATST|nr:hypothetical protein [Datura stramonium]
MKKNASIMDIPVGPSHQVFEKEERRIAFNFLSALFSVLGPFLTEDHGPITSDTKHDFSKTCKAPQPSNEKDFNIKSISVLPVPAADVCSVEAGFRKKDQRRRSDWNSYSKSVLNPTVARSPLAKPPLQANRTLPGWHFSTLAEEDCSYSSRFENRFKPSHRSSSVQKVNSIAILSFLLRPGMKHYPSSRCFDFGVSSTSNESENSARESGSLPRLESESSSESLNTFRNLIAAENEAEIYRRIRFLENGAYYNLPPQNTPGDYAALVRENFNSAINVLFSLDF